MADLDSAEEKINRILLRWFHEDPVMLNVFCMINKEPDPKQETIGLEIRTKVPTLKYNPNFVNSIPEEKLELVMVIEGFKILLRHCTTRLKEPPQISSLASSITINQLLNSNLEKILGSLGNFAPNPKTYNLEENQYFEEYFRKLMEQAKDTNEKIKQIWDSMSDEQKQELIDKASSSKSKSESIDTSLDKDGYKDFNNQTEAMKDYFDPNGTSNQGWGENDLFDAEVSNYINSKLDSANGWGKHTGKAIATIIAANKPKISYKEVIRRFHRSVIMDETISSRMKVNRRYGLDFPGYRRKYKSKIIFAVDVSGSMRDEDLAEGFAVINMICKHSEIIFVQFDTEIKSIERKFKKAKQSFKVHGRGGTDFQQIIDFADKENVDGVVIFTDGIAPAPKQPKHAKVLWLMHTGGRMEPPVKWGYVSVLNRFEDTHTW